MAVLEQQLLCNVEKRWKFSHHPEHPVLRLQQIVVQSNGGAHTFTRGYS